MSILNSIWTLLSKNLIFFKFKKTHFGSEIFYSKSKYVNFSIMSAQQKKSANIEASQAEKRLSDKTHTGRPNIDHLLKKINLEKRYERQNNIIMMIIGIVVVAIVSFIFTQV